jgi:hypothetical protein
MQETSRTISVLAPARPHCAKKETPSTHRIVDSVGLQIQFLRFGEVRNFLPLPGINHDYYIFHPTD